MKKIFLLSLCSVFLLNSCGTYTSDAVWAGGSLGSVLGSAIGGIAGGPRGSDIGTIVGMVGGADVGASVSQKKECESQERYDAYGHDVTTQPDSDNSGFDASNGGDDRLYELDSCSLEIRNARFIDANQNDVIDRNEVCKLVFEIYNIGNEPILDVMPMVVDLSNNPHIYISPSVYVEKISPGYGIRYTAIVKSDKRLRDGMLKLCASVTQGNKTISKTVEFHIPTHKG
jgi:hypothetical protein